MRRKKEGKRGKRKEERQEREKKGRRKKTDSSFGFGERGHFQFGSGFLSFPKFDSQIVPSKRIRKGD